MVKPWIIYVRIYRRWINNLFTFVFLMEFWQWQVQCNWTLATELWKLVHYWRHSRCMSIRQAADGASTWRIWMKGAVSHTHTHTSALWPSPSCVWCEVTMEGPKWREYWITETHSLVFIHQMQDQTRKHISVSKRDIIFSSFMFQIRCCATETWKFIFAISYVNHP